MDLCKAASQGDTGGIESAIEEGCDVNAPNKYGKTPLWSAVQSGQADACRLLIAEGASMERQKPGILEVAVQGEHTEVVELLWPHCGMEEKHRSLETAISLGFHGIADFLIGTGVFEYQHSPANGTKLLIEDGCPRRQLAAFQQWERFLFVRHGEKLHLHRTFFDYALLLAAKADRNAGLRLVNLLLEEREFMADANCKIKIDEQTETPLTAAAEKGNLEILATLMDRPNTKLTICGKYKWPAFLHLLATSESITTERGRAIARKLSSETFSNPFLVDSKVAPLETVFENVLRYGDDGFVKQVIDLVQGSAGNVILPPLIRANETHGLRWILNGDIARASKPPPMLWVLLCDFFQRHPHAEALNLFSQVAEFMVQNAIWNRIILVCLHSRNFCFLKQFFYPLHEIPPREVTEETLVGFPQASVDRFLVRKWVETGFANAALWSAIQSGIWKSPNFESLLSCPHIDLNRPQPQERGSETAEARNDFPPFSSTLTSEKQKFSFRDTAGIPLRFLDDSGVPGQRAFEDYQMQLCILEQQNKRRLLMARNEIVDTNGGKSPLAWAATSRNVQLVEVLLRSPRVNVNSQDAHNRTPPHARHCSQ
ncbi:uncharacterized protein N7482_008218 [Penicillium canariense]|uniref:Uncharacterized protein n=1 Tax=Penicillium canariense TaxID=189055 RepID=A0A9W9HSR2_9EURO|nr:uncharacterized protein N7482_008218 [Penicillium canariense]KAJ5157118.1 hypothetical protein N7482_008218 [Penicillium canariense]